MSEVRGTVNEPSHWDDLPFKLPPLPFRGRIKRVLTGLLCLLGTAIAKFTRGQHENAQAFEPRKILIVRRGGLGDILMATPLLRALRGHFPSATIYVLTSKQALVGLSGSPWVDQTFHIPSSLRDWPPLLRKLRQEQIDTAFILHRFFAPSLLALCAGIPRRLGFGWENHGFVLTNNIPFSPARSQTLQIGQLLTLLGKPAADDRIEFPVREQEIRSARKILQAWGLDRSKPVVGIHPGGGETAISSDPAKRWSPERFGALADLLIERKGLQIVLLQGPGDEPFVRETLKNMSAHPLGVASDLPFTVFAAVVRECDVVVVNDTGPMHLAAAQSVPTVAIIGPTHPAYTPPRGETHKIIWAGMHCSPCYNPEEYTFGERRDGKKLFECWRGTHECMTAITPEQVYDIVIQQTTRLKNGTHCEPARSTAD